MDTKELIVLKKTKMKKIDCKVRFSNSFLICYIRSINSSLMVRKHENILQSNAYLPPIRMHDNDHFQQLGCML